MSKYKSSGRGKASNRAGLQFDKLLKACSNSKKLPTAMAAGAIGRFGVAQFTSARSNIESPGEEIQEEKTSRFSSLNKNKRARLDSSTMKSMQQLPSGADPILNNHIPANSTPPQTVFKPRKFFKSRGPMEVEVDPNQARPLRPDVANMIPAFTSNPILGSNQSNINNSTHSSPGYYHSNSNNSSNTYHHETLKNTTNTTISPSKSTSSVNNNNNSFSSVCSPPIKLKIIKDKTTSKFVSISDTTPSPGSNEVSPQFPHSQHHHHHHKSEKDSSVSLGKSKKDKEKKREKKASKKLEEKPVKVKSRKVKEPKVKVQKPAKEVPKRTSGRVTRSTTRHNDDDGDSPTGEDGSDSGIVGIDGQENLSLNPRGDISSVGLTATNGASRGHLQPEDTLRRLEEDAEFQKLSQMLSSMEEEQGSSVSISQQPAPGLIDNTNGGRSHNSGISNNFGTSTMHQEQSQQASVLQREQHNSPKPESQDSVPYHPMNLSSYHNDSNSESDSASSYQSQSFSNLNPNPYFLPPPSHNQNVAGPSSSSRSDNFRYESSSNQVVVSNSHHPHQETTENKVQDIRSILEDDWNESLDEESPRKSQAYGGSSDSSCGGTSNQSPPKVSRFDASAFMPHQQSKSPSPPQTSTHGHGVDEYQNHNQNSSNRREFHENIQRPIPVYGTQLPNPNPPQSYQQQQHHPFNINSSPYSMKNLLSCPNPEDTGKGPSNYDDGEMSDEPQNLCSKTNKDENLPSVRVGGGDSEAKSEETQGPDSAGNSQNSQLLVNSQESAGSSSIPSSQNSQQSQSKTTTNTTKKASIFKSRAAKGDSGNGSGSNNAGEGKKRLALYKHTFGGQHGPTGGETPMPSATLYGDFDEFDDDEDGDDGDLKLRKLRINNSSAGYSSRLVGGEDEGVSKVLCKKEVKKLFTVVRNVKASHELQESGEFHEFDGDVWYILEHLKDKNPMNSRCLSAITLAQRCMDQSFRMHLRAHGTVGEFCKELHDAPQHPVLSLLAATVLFVLSQDRLNMDLDTESLKLILALTKSEVGSQQDMNENSETIKNRLRVMELCSEMKNRGHAKHLKLEKLTASELALETLLYLTSKRAGEWVKHELRALGGLDSIVGEVESSFSWVKDEIRDNGWSENVMERLRKVDRCLQVLQQVTFNHEDNQRYLMQVSTREVDGGVVKCTEASPEIFLEMFKFCRKHLELLNVQVDAAGIVREILFSVLRLLVNLSHDYRGIVLGSEIMLGINGFLELSLHSTFQMTRHFPDEKVFDLLMHSLCLLLNLVEYSKKNRHRILQSTIRKNACGSYSIGLNDSVTESDDSGVEEELPVLDALIHMFLSRERSAKKEEQHTDNILTTGTDDRSQGSSGTSSSASHKDANSQEQEGTSVQDTIDKLIQTAGKHMENSLIAAYISLLIAYLIMDDLPSVEQVRNSMPEGKFLPLMVVLKKLFNFMSITSSASGSTRGLKATAIALTFYSKADPGAEEELKKIIPD